MTRIRVPCVCREVATDFPILVFNHAGHDLGVIFREDGRRLGLSVMADQWWDVHLFPTSEDPSVYAGVLKAYSLHCGADPDAAQVLRRFVTITDEEYTRMTEVAKPAAKKPAAKKTATVAERKKAVAAAPAAKAPKTPKTPAAPKERARTASTAFCELIMKGKQSDDAIFAAVQKEFGLDDTKRSYVGWYRNKLKKDGMSPPAAIKAA